MKAVILAAGKGERLKGVVDDIPKPMIRYRGRPILQHNIELCTKFGIREILINTHHLPEIIRNYFGDGSGFGVKIQYSYEEVLLGTAGALNNFRDQLAGEQFFVVYGDNYSDFDLGSLMTEFEKHDCIGVIGFHYRKDVSQSGVGEFASDGRIVRFLEKPIPGTTHSHWVSAGIYFLSPEILKSVPKGFCDFGKDLFPTCIRKGIALYSFCSRTPLKAFDTPDLLRSSVGNDRSC